MKKKERFFVTYRELLGKHIDELGKILIAFEMNSPAAIRMRLHYNTTSRALMRDANFMSPRVTTLLRSSARRWSRTG